MAKTSGFQGILSEIELFLNAGRYEDAKILLNFVDHDAADRTTRLHLLLINAIIDGPAGYKGEIDSLACLSNPNEIEKEITRKILLLASDSEADGRNDRPHSHPPNQSFDETASHLSPGNLVEENAECLRNYESELAALKEQLAELAASKDRTLGSLQATVIEQAELLQAKEADLDALETHYSGIIGTLENQLHDKEDLRTAHEAELQAARAEVGRLTAEFAEFANAKDLQLNALCAELTHQTELLQANDYSLMRLETHYAEQLHAMENQLGEQQSLLQRRDAELDSCNIRLRELIREHAELDSAREMSENSAREELRAKLSQLQTMSSAIEELEARSSATVSSLQRQLKEKQKIVEHREVELAELRNQIRGFTEKQADAEGERYGDETATLSEHHQASFEMPPSRAVHNDGTPVRFRISKSIDIASIVFWETVSDTLNRLRQAWLGTWKPQIFSQTAIPVAGSVLLIIPIAYLLGGQVRTTANTGKNEDPKQSQEREVINRTVSPSKESTTPPKVGTSKAKGLQYDTRQVPVSAVIYITRRAVTLRDSPRYGGIAKTQINSGTEVSVLASQGDWFKIKAQPTGTIGYVRKEYLVAHNYAQY